MTDSGGQRKRSRRSKGDVDQAKLIRALNHDLRRQILRFLNESEEPQSPVKIARRLGKPLSNISYHIKVLHQLGAVERVAERPVRGAVEHFHASTVKDNAPILALLEGTREMDEASGSDRR